ncbi:uncharacterized protein LOC118805174 [Colossoma macropomum]|uniref:uncharacterized protein LOC118805174 n=1 Tax=Colossoma macropomum TaxID=42526 RepID=UPI0018648158|nr:uncharacterized protein LOC118805174 [Colossoma macropomum]
MKKIIVQGKPHLCVFVMRDIMPGEKITYDCGGSDWHRRRKPAHKDTANIKDNVEPSRSASGPVTNAGASTSDLKPLCEDTANMMDVVESIRSASSPVTNTGSFSSGLKPACEDTTNMMDDVEPSHSTLGPLTNTGASSSDLKPECEDAANVMAIFESSHSASGPVTNAGASCTVLKVFKRECDAPLSLQQVSAGQDDGETGQLPRSIEREVPVREHPGALMKSVLWTST